MGRTPAALVRIGRCRGCRARKPEKVSRQAMHVWGWSRDKA
ncbi:hypothetical protein NOC27_1345 [Nitrosococcus oceani AFC27]|nr:hypothetical protein NOC27_1345 [Nitrosococcus oceani AFC27]